MNGTPNANTPVATPATPPDDAYLTLSGQIQELTAQLEDMQNTLSTWPKPLPVLKRKANEKQLHINLDILKYVDEASRSVATGRRDKALESVADCALYIKKRLEAYESRDLASIG